jgi:hypothetical protein
MLQVLVNISLEKFCCIKETGGYVKEKVKKRKKKKKREIEKKWIQKDVQSIENNGYLDVCHEKREKREITPALVNISSSNKRDMS